LKEEEEEKNSFKKLNEKKLNYNKTKKKIKHKKASFSH